MKIAGYPKMEGSVISRRTRTRGRTRTGRAIARRTRTRGRTRTGR